MAKLAPHGINDATNRQDTIRNWFAVAPFANIGLATGRAIVLDVDPRHGGDASLRALEAEHEPLPQTCRSLTGGGGEHIFFKPPVGVEIRNSAGDLAPGLDVRGVGGYIVAPSSVHASGRSYEWSVDHHPDDVLPAPMPSWMVTALMQPKSGTTRDSTDWQTLAAEGVLEGERNKSITRLTGHLLRHYVDPGLAHELMQTWNLTRCRPPMTSEEVTKTVASIARKELKRREARNGNRP